MRPDQLTEEELLEALRREMIEAGAMPIDLSPASAFHLAGLVQLAMRHPDLSLHSRELAERFLANVRAHFAAAPAVLEVLRRGDRP
jgi:hypothetical protein